MPGSVLGAKDTRRRGDLSLKDSAAGIVGGSQHKTGPGRDADTSQRRCGKRGVAQTSEVTVKRAPSIPEVCVACPVCPGHSLRSFEETHSPHPREKNWHSVTGKIKVHT